MYPTLNHLQCLYSNMDTCQLSVNQGAPVENDISILRAFDAINKPLGYTCMLWFSSVKKDIKHDRDPL